MKNKKLFILAFFVILVLLVSCGKRGDMPQNEKGSNVGIPTRTPNGESQRDPLVTSRELEEMYSSNLNIKPIFYGDMTLSFHGVTDEKYTVTKDFNGDGKNETVDIFTSSYYGEEPEGVTYGNKPLKIHLKTPIGDTVYENEWNDGIYLHTVKDFENFNNIFITSSGTGSGDFWTSIYRYNGGKFYLHADFTHCTPTIYEDNKGRVYFIAIDWPEKTEPKLKVFDWLTKEIVTYKE
jgi:hypothetical protein